MTFERPDAWWLLLAALPMIALHLHFRRRRRHVVPSVQIWRELAAVPARSSGLRALRDRAGLLLALAALTLLAAALSGPTSGAAAGAPLRLAIVVDGSATMNARTQAGGTRFEAAVAAAGKAMRALREGDEVAVWVAGESPRLWIAPTRDVRSAFALVRAAHPTLAPRSLATTVRLAHLAATRRGTRDARVLVFTDRAGAAALPEPEDVVVGVVDAAEDAVNSGIERVELPAGALASALVRVVTTDGVPTARRLEVVRGGRVVGATEVTPGPEPIDVRVDLGSAAGGGPCTLRLEPPDAFPQDDALGLVLPAPLRLRVLVVAPSGQASPFLVEALGAARGMLDPAGAFVASPSAAVERYASADVVVVEGPLPGDVPARLPVLAFSETGGTRVERPLVWSSGDHEVLAGVDLNPLRLDRAAVLEPTAAEVVLAGSTAGAVALAGEDEGARWVRVGFRPEASTLALEPAFPLLVRNALRWLVSPRRLPPSVRAGGPLTTARVAGRELLVEGPGARRASVPVVDGRIDFVVPRPGPGDASRLVVTSTSGAEETEVHWDRPRGFRLGVDGQGTPALDAAAALASLPDPADRAGDRERHASTLAGLAALALVAGAFLLRRERPPERVAERSGADLLRASTQSIRLPTSLR